MNNKVVFIKKFLALLVVVGSFMLTSAIVSDWDNLEAGFLGKPEIARE